MNWGLRKTYTVPHPTVQPLRHGASAAHTPPMPFVVFACPRVSPNASQMIEAIARLPDVRVGVVTTDPADAMPESVRRVVAAHWRIDSLFDTGQLAWAVRELSAHAGPVHRLFGAYEQLQVPLAQVRELMGIDGTTAEAARNFRDKSRMKEILRRSGLPCARHALVSSADEAVAFGAASGYPMVVKPPSGAGAVATFRVDSADQLRQGLAAMGLGDGEPVLLEEFVQGEEHSCESITINGRTVWQSITRYSPTPLDVKRNPWIQWSVLLPREQQDPTHHDIREAAARALTALGMDTGLSHMEWFRRPDGSIAISEVAARPPGANITTMIARAHDMDFIQAWARVMIFGEFSAPPRKYAVGCAYLRGQGSGRIRAIHGHEIAVAELGSLVCDVQLPQIGDIPRDTYEGDGYIIVRHPDTAVVERALLRLISTVRVELG